LSRAALAVGAYAYFILDFCCQPATAGQSAEPSRSPPRTATATLRMPISPFCRAARILASVSGSIRGRPIGLPLRVPLAAALDITANTRSRIILRRLIPACCGSAPAHPSLDSEPEGGLCHESRSVIRQSVYRLAISVIRRQVPPPWPRSRVEFFRSLFQGHRARRSCS
jgi:hypothetical protein